MTWDINRNRNIRRELTFTPEEWEQAEGLWAEWKDFFPSYCNFARRMLTRGEVNVTPMRPLTDPAPIVKEISRIGVNINQIAHWANENRNIAPSEIVEMREAQKKIEQLISILLDDAFEQRELARKTEL